MNQKSTSLGGGGYMTLFMATLEGIKGEEHVKTSDCAPGVLELISAFEDRGDCDATRDVVVTLCSRVQSCACRCW